MERLKFTLEINEQGNLECKIVGSGYEIGEQLFLPFFKNDPDAKFYAVGIDTAIKCAYPQLNKKKNGKTNS